MSKRFFAVAFAIGLATVAWVGLGFIGSSWIALGVTALIAGVYLLGAFELLQFRAAGTALSGALAEIPEPPFALADWLERVPPALRNAVRLRIEGERSALPGPALTPYLVGLLVMLGMLGTFLGMVVTFKGAVFALEASADLQAMRSALAEPIKGLGLAFGTSVAGVAASAMLGLMSAISRRERLDVARLLDSRIAGVLRPFSLVHQRQETLRALQAQATALPEVFGRLDTLMERIEGRSRQLDEQLLGRQQEFHGEVKTAYTALAGAVGASLQDSLAAGARAAGESIRPVVESAMAQLVQESQRSNDRLGDVARAQVEQHGQHMDRLAGLWDTQLHALRREEDLRGEAAVERLGELQAAVAQQLATLGTALEAPIAGVLRTAAEVPQAAAGVLEELRREVSRFSERDTLALQERTRLLEQLAALLQVVNQAAGEQRAATEALVASASSVLEQAGKQFADTLDAQAGKAAEMATQVTGSAIELSSLGEAFGHGVQLFQASNEKLTESLQRIEASINASTARSDEQLAYYVAQAREVIDLSIASQHSLVDKLRQVQGRPVAVSNGGNAANVANGSRG